MIKITKVGKRIAINGKTQDDNIQEKIIKAINRIEKELGLPETDFTDGDDNVIPEHQRNNQVL